ncbi:MAG: hypothetical protein M1829_000631 [Trizodia sp. TS-e1964]|nr:MAG: hypothetical protein M1829_000631 [Trizodia sp. TS-e1964]
MSVSPLKEADLEARPQSPDETDHMDREGRDTQAQILGYEFEVVKEQDRWLPIANVARIMKTALPENAKIAKEAKECMQECVSEFISFITSEGDFLSPSMIACPSDLPLPAPASEKCQQEKRKTVNGEDILFAMTSLGFENYAEALKIYLSKYREVTPSYAAFRLLQGENQNRSIGAFGSGGGVGGHPSSTDVTSAAAFQPANESANSLLSPQAGNMPDHDNGTYGSVFPQQIVGAGHNGTITENYQ